jgi:hypothetical protein
MRKYLILLLGLFTTPIFAYTAHDCYRSLPMRNEAVHLVVQALRMHKRDAAYQEIAQWRVNTFNPEIDRIETTNRVTPQEMMNPDLELTRLAYNDVVMRSKIYVGKVFSYARGNTTKESVNEQRVLINEASKKIVAECRALEKQLSE